MTKTLKLLLVSSLFVFIFSFVLGSKSIPKVSAEEEHHFESCNDFCPTIHWEWHGHKIDIPYFHDRRNNLDWCHGPSDDSLKHDYHMDDDFFKDFRDHFSEWRDRDQRVCPSITPKQSPTPSADPTQTPAPTSAPSNNSNGGGSSQSHDAPVCNDTDPGAPTNLKAIALGGGKVKLTWDNAPGPHTSYAVAYGPSIGNYLYGDPNVGNVTTYTVLALNPGGNYCFYVQAQNGCKGGIPSNVVCTNQPGTVRVLGVSTNDNPLIDGIKESFGGEVLGAFTELMNTAEVVYSTDKLPSGNKLIEGASISIPAIGVDQPLYQPQIIADQLAVGQHEVLNTIVDGSNVFYGHNGYDVFGSLFKVIKGNKVIINRNNQTSSYIVTATDFVKKDDVNVLKTSADQIVLITCSFTQPDYRIIVKALLQK